MNMDNLKIEQCSIKDIKKLIKIGERTFYETFKDGCSKEDMDNYLKKSFSYKQLEVEINNDKSKFYIFENDNELIGYMKLNFTETKINRVSEKSLEIQRIYVMQKYKGNHIGKKLVEKAIEVAKGYNQNYIWLGVWENNLNAIKFYEKLGFKKYSSHIFKLGEDEQTDNLMKLIITTCY